MNFKYRLIEQEEEDGLKGLRGKNELFLTSEKYTADELLKILNDPKNLGDTYVGRSKELDDLYKRVFGIPTASDKENKDLYNTEYNGFVGKDLYRDIISKVSKKFDRVPPFTKKDENGETMYYFFGKTKNNEEVVKDYYLETSDSAKKFIKADITPKKIGDREINFPLNDDISLKKILKAAGLKSGVDYELTKQKVEESTIRNTVREQIKKLYK
jgi:hypothetical protein